ncbi:SAM-dependent methyltransferase [Virgibacillus phasianinus]|uniref:SAM-dependent methyltransferase n=1 Tax=Virgibacillus phasianinus TaxID=2017483 RepID=A0A220U4Y1_9BACI|nr:class I SAM-dependent methyltransferase [Virgibacillus phasianinus]ASK62783.1 SAM-dependent methyltransferase [Virgibacillus phasianinus]
MGKWFPRFYDIAMKPLENTRFKKIRARLIGKATGRVLEIGSGSGVNFSYYLNVDQVDAIEPNPLMSDLSHKSIRNSKVSIRLHQVNAEKLPFADNTFDSVVATLVFCTIPNPKQALKEIQRVCKPGAGIFIFEHVKMNQELLAKLQDALTPLWEKVCDGCHLNRDTLRLLKESGIDLGKIDYYYKGLFLAVEATNNK